MNRISDVFWLISATMILAFSFVAPESAFAQYTPCPFWGSGMMGGTWGWIGGIFMILFWVLIVVGIVFFIRSFMTSRKIDKGPSFSSAESPLDILQKRYARGEINKEEYQSIKNDLELPPRQV